MLAARHTLYHSRATWASLPLLLLCQFFQQLIIGLLIITSNSLLLGLAVVAITSVSLLFATGARSIRTELADSHPATDVMWRDIARAGFVRAISSLRVTDFDLPFFESLRHFDAYHILDGGRGMNWLAATSGRIQGFVRKGIFKKLHNTFAAIVVSTFRLENIRQWILFRTRCTRMLSLSLFFAGFSDTVV